MDLQSKPEVIWLIAGILLLLLEFATPGLLVVFFGLGALVTALLTYLTDMGIILQVISFVFFSLVFLFLLRPKFMSLLAGTSESDPEEEFVGHTAVAEVDIPPHQVERVEFRGTKWNAISEKAIAKGDRFVITGLDGLTLKIKPQKEV